MIEFTIPLVPPSVNTYTRHARGRHFKTKEAAAFEAAFPFFFRNPGCVGETFRVEIDVWLGPKMHRDIDNLPKQVLDGISRGGLLVNGKGKILSDYAVKELEVRMFSDERDNQRTTVRIYSLDKGRKS